MLSRFGLSGFCLGVARDRFRAGDARRLLPLPLPPLRPLSRSTLLLRLRFLPRRCGEEPAVLFDAL